MSARDELNCGETLGRYVILSREGVGGMGVVYAAYDPRLDRKVALKLLRAGPGESPSEEDRARLLREAQAMARLSHPCVVQVYDVGDVDGEVYIAMEHVEGRTLRDWLAERPRSTDEVLRAFTEAGRGLAAAHAAGIVHRDFKPENVLVDRDGRVRVTDFGLARRAGRPGAGAGGPAPAATVLVTGTQFGTPAYAAPEQFTGDPVDHRTDQFSFCVSLYEALHGEPPFDASSEAGRASAVVLGRIRPAPANPRVPGWLRDVVVKGLAPAPGSRHASMDRLLARLARAPGRRLRRALPWAVAAAAVGCMALVQPLAVRHQQQLCLGAPRRLAGIWDDQRREAVRQALLATERPYSATAARGAVEALDAYAAAWSAMYADACQATQVHHDQTEQAMELRMHCLGRRLGELSAVVDLLSGPEAPAEQAVTVARGLRSVSPCADAAALQGPVEPAEASQRDAVAAARRDLDRTRALLSVGRYGQSLDLARAVVERARAVRYAPLLSEALWLEGRAQLESGDPGAAEASLYEAVQTAEIARDDELRARAWAELIGVQGVWLGRYREAYRSADQARSVLERLGPGHDDVRAQIETQLGFALREDGRRTDALERFRTALVLRRKSLPPEHPEIVLTHNAIALALADLGRLQEAVAEERRVIPALEASLGGEHPLVASARDNLGTQLVALGRYQESLPLLERGLAIRRANLGEQDLDVSASLANLASSRAQLGDPRGALPLAEEGLARIERVEGRTLYWAQVSDVLGEIHRLAGDLPGARMQLAETIEASTKVAGADHPVTATALAHLAECDLDGHAPAAALERFRRALAIHEKRLGPDHPEVSHDLAGMGRALLAQRRAAEALEPLERAWGIGCDRSPAGDAEIAFALARASWESGRTPEDALGYARAARSALSRGEGRDRLLLPEVEGWLRAHEAQATSGRARQGAAAR